MRFVARRRGRRGSEERVDMALAAAFAEGREGWFLE